MTDNAEVRTTKNNNLIGDKKTKFIEDVSEKTCNATQSTVNNVKFPMIRLKLKVNKDQPSSKKNDIKDLKIIKRETSCVAVNKFYGTFKYRPFKLFPLLSAPARYRVLVSSKYTSDLSNHPAIRRNYFWNLYENESIYTDDSDLICIVLKDKWYGLKELTGSTILIEVEVVEDHVERTNRIEQVHMCHTESIEQSNCTNMNVSSIKSLNPRVCSNHDGNYIRIINCSLNPQTVHVKRWRKMDCLKGKKPEITTPQFKTESGNNKA